MKTALVIVALMVVIVAVQAGGEGKGKCNEKKLKRWCGEKKEGGEEKGKGEGKGKGKGKGKWMKNMSEECKTEFKTVKTAGCTIFNADNTKFEEACKAMTSPAWEKCKTDMKGKKDDEKEDEKKDDE